MQNSTISNTVDTVQVVSRFVRHFHSFLFFSSLSSYLPLLPRAWRGSLTIYLYFSVIDWFFSYVFCIFCFLVRQHLLWNVFRLFAYGRRKFSKYFFVPSSAYYTTCSNMATDSLSWHLFWCSRCTRQDDAFIIAHYHPRKLPMVGTNFYP